MNEGTLERAKQAGFKVDWQHEDVQAIKMARFEKFEKLIVQECIDKILNCDDQFYMDRKGLSIGCPMHNAWMCGVLDSVSILREHFGVELEVQLEGQT